MQKNNSAAGIVEFCPKVQSLIESNHLGTKLIIIEKFAQICYNYVSMHTSGGDQTNINPSLKILSKMFGSLKIQINLSRELA